MSTLFSLRSLWAALIAAATLAVVVPGAVAAPIRAAAVPPPPPCVAQAVASILVDAGSYSPATRSSPTPGTTFGWTWNTATPESVTSGHGLPLLASSAKTSGTYDVTIWSAGSFPYHSSTDLSQKGTVEVSMCNVPKTAHVNTTVTFQVAQTHRRGWVADIQVLRPGTTKWVWLHTDVTTIYSTFAPKRVGTYELRARLRDKLAKASSEMSPVSRVKVG
jgi:plastocyanin